ncbi:MAG: lysophospholipid acyltransferase family protein [Muribaculum sp.]|nr:lysophospholipid acyltransferase family protein [Muribaculum sp.]
MKSELKYLPVKWMLEGLARLPFGILYFISDILYFLIYYVVGYRKKVAMSNIRSSFPEKCEPECKAILKQFFRNFTDYFVETIKLAHISDEEMKRRMVFVGIEEIDKAFDEGRSIAMYFSHCGNWEWAPSITLWSRHKPSDKLVYAQVYRPLKNKWFDSYFLKLRSRFGSFSYDKKMVFRDLLKLKRDDIQSITGFMSDQKPSHGDVGHIMMFLNHPTAIITGTEILARRLDLEVFYWDVEKPSRGHYRLIVRKIAEHPDDMPLYSITDTYGRMLEETIRRNPSIWLWTHKRWKHKVEMPTEP